MKTTLELFKDYKVATVNSTKTERGELLSFFLEKMNESRRSGGYKEWKMSSIGYFLAPFSIENLYQLKGQCERAKNFGACFNHYVFPKKLSTGSILH